jgi:phage terminase large subunit
LGDPDEYNHTWLGNPVSKEMNGIINGAEVLAAMKRKVEPTGSVEIGCDVARFGDDTTVITKRKGYKVFPQRVFQKIDTVKTFGYCMDTAENDKSIQIKVDDTGVGGGVTDNLTDSKYNAIGVNNNQTPKNKDRYTSAIDEMWFELAEMMPLIELPYSEKLKDQLTQRRYGIDRQGRRFVESKKEYKLRCGESPDLADSLLLAFYHPLIKTYTPTEML